MVYAGYTPAKLPPAQPSELESALWTIPSMESLEVLGKLTYNCVVQPKDDKYRKIRMSNEKINAAIAQVPGALAALSNMGWVNDGDEFLVLPQGKYLTMKEFRAVDDAKQRLSKKLAEAAKERMRHNAAAASAVANASNPSSSNSAANGIALKAQA